MASRTSQGRSASLASLAEEVTAAVMTAMQRNDKVNKLLTEREGLVLVRPIILAGGWIALGRGRIDQLAGQLDISR